MSRPNSTVLHHAIATGDIETLQTLLKQGSVDADTRLQIDDEVLETANRKSLISLRSYRKISVTGGMTGGEPIREEDSDGANTASEMATEENKMDLTVIEDQDEDERSDDGAREEIHLDFGVANITETQNREGKKADFANNKSDDAKAVMATISSDPKQASPPVIVIDSYDGEHIDSPVNEIEDSTINTHDNDGVDKVIHPTEKQGEIHADDEAGAQENEVTSEHAIQRIVDNGFTNTSDHFAINDEMSIVHKSKSATLNDEIDAIDKIMKECQHTAEEINKEVVDGEPDNTEEQGYLQAEPLSGGDHDADDQRAQNPRMERLRDRDSGNDFNYNNNNNNDRISLADTIDLKLRDENGGLFERAPSMRIKESSTNNNNDESGDEDNTGGSSSTNNKKLIPRLKRKISLKFTRKPTKKDILEEDDGDDFEDELIYQNLVKTRNVDDEQLDENFEGVAFFEAVRDGMDMIVTTLLETSDGYQLNMLDENGFTPAMQASWHGQPECLQILISHGANTDLRNATGCTATHFAAGQGKGECLRLLIEDDPEHINVKTKFGATPLILAAKGGHTQCVEILLEAGADPNIQYRGNQNALLFAAGNGHYECLESLIEHGVEMDQPNSQKVTPLMRAVQQGHNTCVTLLTDKGADINTQDAIGRTALHFAVEHNNPKGLKLLLQAGANFDLKTKGGSRPYAYAERFRNVRCAEMLENHINKLKEDQEGEKEPETSAQQQRHHISLLEKKEKKNSTVSCFSFKHIFRRRTRKNSLPTQEEAPNS